MTSSAITPAGVCQRSAQPTGPGFQMSNSRNSAKAAATPIRLRPPAHNPSSAIHCPANSSITIQPGSPLASDARTAQTPPILTPSAAPASSQGDAANSPAPITKAAADPTVPGAFGA